MSTIAMAANPVMHAKTKHVDLDLHFVRERVLNNALQVSYVPAGSQIADVLTKPLAVQLFTDFRKKLNVLPAPFYKEKKENRMNVSQYDQS
ncbi:hypothetical protein HRI_000862400 [Hibiscus trionum]|uniref:Uncharacterized protein n=1 Tax=Hibiscus trionum TaxID=183268 RepID=A0A9W7LQ47_HIBTR|nr:hypothetical protein HRI_000862400 [Hibiscus trionum]